MTIDSSNLNILWGSLLVEELIRNGVDYFVISPGSRSSPLTAAVARHGKAKKIVCFDERGAAFHALGYARASGNIAVLICTSGTAAANYFPAIIEASVNMVPMLILSGDRPPELRQTGANQTIQQFNLFGEYVRWQFDLPAPDVKIPASMVLTTVDQAIYQALRSPIGPVHINCMFREPLAPTPVEIEESYLSSLLKWKEQNLPYTRYGKFLASVDPSLISEVASIINQTQRGVIAVGQLNSNKDREAIANLAAKIHWPVFADIQSGMRLSETVAPVIHYFDQLLLDDVLSEVEPLSTVLQFGSCIVSKRFSDLIARQNSLNHLVILEHPFREDPNHQVSVRIEANIGRFCEEIEPLVEETLNNYTTILKNKSKKVDDFIDDFLLNKSDLDEPTVSRIVSKYIPEDHGLFLASSMPIRDVDMYGVHRRRKVVVAANRGASGIEGTIASATGFAVGLQAPVTLLMGDLAFIHDLNSLALIKSLEYPVIIVVINNDGGGIFSFLPIATFTDIFEPYFGTSHELNFNFVAKMFKINYFNPQKINDFIEIYKNCVYDKIPAVIEINTNRKDNFLFHKKLQEKIKSLLQIME